MYKTAKELGNKLERNGGALLKQSLTEISGWSALCPLYGQMPGLSFSQQAWFSWKKVH